MGSTSFKRVQWSELCGSERYSGCWVALDNVRYDPSTCQALEGDLVDVDEDLGDLCARMRDSHQTSCAILFCEDEPRSRVTARRPSGTARLQH